MVNEVFEGKRLEVGEDDSEVGLLDFEQVRRVQESLIGSLGDLFIGSNIAGADFGFLQELG